MEEPWTTHSSLLELSTLMEQNAERIDTDTYTEL